MILSMCWLLTSVSLAQAPAAVPTLAPAAVATDAPEKRWAVSDVDSKRFADDDTAGPTFKAGDELLLIVTDGSRVRVRRGDRYGWVPASAVTAEAPAPAPASLDLLGLPPTLGSPGGAPQLAPGGAPPLLGAGAGAGGGG